MKSIKKIKQIKQIKQTLCIGFILILWVFSSYASEAQEKVYLEQILNQLNAMQPLIMAAQKEQPNNMRIPFHYIKFRDHRGHWHAGLLEDVLAIKKGIEEKLNAISIEPRVVTPIAGDYLMHKGGNPS